MDDRLLPTPNASNLNDGQTEESWRVRRKRERAKGYNGNGGATPLAMAVPLIAKGIDPNDGDLPTSVSSPGSEGSTSPPKPTASPASARSSGTPPAPESSSDGGRLFPDGETWLRSVEVMPTEVPTSSSVASLDLASQSPPPDAARPRTITAGSGPSSPVALASLNPDGSWSRTYRDFSTQESLWDQPSAASSPTWPTSGMTRRGRAYALPTSAPAIGDSDSSSLRTPLGNEANPGAGGELRAQIMLGPDRRNGTGIDSMGRPNRGRTLPTPAARDWRGTNIEPGTVDQEMNHRSRSEGGTSSLADAVRVMLPTPRTNEATGLYDGQDGGESLKNTIASLGDHTPPASNDGSES